MSEMRGKQNKQPDSGHHLDAHGEEMFVCAILNNTAALCACSESIHISGCGMQPNRIGIKWGIDKRNGCLFVFYEWFVFTGVSSADRIKNGMKK